MRYRQMYRPASKRTSRIQGKSVRTPRKAYVEEKEEAGQQEISISGEGEESHTKKRTAQV